MHPRRFHRVKYLDGALIVDCFGALLATLPASASCKDDGRGGSLIEKRGEVLDGGGLEGENTGRRAGRPDGVEAAGSQKLQGEEQRNRSAPRVPRIHRPIFATDEASLRTTEVT